jgi:alkylhydroperoxidase family enzyme
MYGKPDALERLVQVILAIAAAFALFTGIFMITDPFGWYDFVDTVKASGPPNGHFIRDIGIAFIVSGVVLTYAAINPVLRWGSAVVGNLFPTFHGVLHIYEVVTGICSPDIFWRDAPGVLGPALAVWVAIGIQFARQRVSPAALPKPMFLKFARNALGDTAAYLDEISRTGGFATEALQHAMPLTAHRYHAPGDLVNMAALGAVRTEDCGPCVEVMRYYSLRDGMDADRIQNALEGRPSSEDDALAFEFGAAIARGDLSRSAELGDRVETAFGKAARTEMTLAAASNRLYPAIKRGLGLASACAIPTRS